MKKIKFHQLLTSLLLTVSLQTKAQGPCLKFHVIHSEPIGFVNNSGTPTGVHWDYLNAIEKDSGICINKELMPYARIWENIKHGKHDGGIIFKSESRSPIVVYASHIKSVPTVVIPLEGLHLKSYDDLRGLLIGTMRGIHLSERFDNDNTLNKIELTNFEQETRMINLKRIDAIAGNGLALMYQLKKFHVIEKVNLNDQLVLGEKEQWLQFSKKSPYLNRIPKLKQSIKKLKQDGTFNKILIKYYGEQ
ncbi:substrate-binding periplasmic protein [Paraglaciecola sp.]|uniref:substrate-binding periplasmic protein n=1 Tax=Paraglaciecola sp. TaxID=1920173 RepID=UPI003EF7BF2B